MSIIVKQMSLLGEQVTMFDPEVVSALMGSSFIEVSGRNLCACVHVWLSGQAIEEEDRDAEAVQKHLTEERAADSHFLKWFDDSHYEEHNHGPLKRRRARRQLAFYN